MKPNIKKALVQFAEVKRKLKLSKEAVGKSRKELSSIHQCYGYNSPEYIEAVKIQAREEENLRKYQSIFNEYQWYLSNRRTKDANYFKKHSKTPH